MSSGVDVSALFERMPGEHEEATRWARAYGDDLGRAWEHCARGDWLLWLAGTLEVDHALITEAACDCAEFSLSLLPLADHERVLLPLLELARDWARGEARADSCARAAKEVLRIDQGEAPHEGRTSPTTGYATAAVSAAVNLPVFRSPLGVACGAAAAALKAAQVATPNDEDAITDAHLRCADLVRERIPFELVATAPAFLRYARSALEPDL